MFTNRNNNSDHSFYMRLALQQAKKTLGNTKENPAVGCVITKKGQLISAGCTSVNGRPHAEQNAVDFCKINLSNSNLYVTLEPCSHHGKTPPCVQLIINNKIKKVFFSIKDPDIRSFNKCSKELKKKGTYIKNGICSSEIKNFYRSYYKFKKDILPFVTCKLAISKDFYTINKKKRWITNKYSRARVQLMRSYHDCIITSSQTIIKDNPMLTCRINGLNNRSPSRIILDNKLRIPSNSIILKESSVYRTIIFYNKFNEKKIKLLKRLKIKIYKISLNENGDLDLRKALIKAKNLGFSRIFLESGIKLTNSFLKANLVDDFKLFISNEKIGKFGLGSIKKYYQRYVKNKKFTNEQVNLFGEKLISYKIK